MNEFFSLNGNKIQLKKEISILNLLEEKKLIGKPIAVNLNNSIVKRSNFSSTKIKNKDLIEVIEAVGGG